MSFLRNRKANVAMMFAFSALPLIFALGAGLDYARVLVVHAELSSALDEAALAVASTGYDPADTTSVTSAQLRAQSFFNANYSGGGLTNGQPAAIHIEKSGDAMTLSTSATVPMTLMAIAGIASVTVDASSSAVAGKPKMWVSFVLDNTGSMCASDADPNNGGPCTNLTGTKLGSLKIAMHQVLAQIKGIADGAKTVQVAIVPFTQGVNVGPSNAKASWLDMQLLPKQPNWTGCVTDRGTVKGPGADDDAYDVDNTLPVAAETLFPAGPDGMCPVVPMVALTNDWTALGDSVDAMKAGTSTNQTIGLVWGWQLMTAGFPFPTGGETAVPALPPGTQRIVVLFSDGANTYNRWSSANNLGPRYVDARMAVVCKNVKADGVTIYAVFVHIGNDPPANVLRDCASPGHYYDATSAAGIVDAFKAIGNAIATAHLTH